MVQKDISRSQKRVLKLTERVYTFVCWRHIFIDPFPSLLFTDCHKLQDSPTPQNLTSFMDSIISFKLFNFCSTVFACGKMAIYKKQSFWMLLLSLLWISVFKVIIFSLLLKVFLILITCWWHLCVYTLNYTFNYKFKQQIYKIPTF